MEAGSVLFGPMSKFSFNICWINASFHLFLTPLPLANKFPKLLSSFMTSNFLKPSEFSFNVYHYYITLCIFSIYLLQPPKIMPYKSKPYHINPSICSNYPHKCILPSVLKTMIIFTIVELYHRRKFYNFI